MLKTLCAGFAALAIVMIFSPVVLAQVKSRPEIFGSATGTAPFNSARSDVAPVYYGGVFRGATFVGGRNVRHNDNRRARYYRSWRDSFSPYWGWAVAAGLLATAPTYYYGVGFGDEFGYEIPAYDYASKYCMRRFNSYDPVTGAYFGRSRYHSTCP